MSKVILAAIDLGPHSRTVVDRALRLARLHGVPLAVVHCLPGEAGKAAADTALRRLAEALPDADRKCLGPVRAVVSGDEATGILEEADALDALVIVVGASRRTFLEQVFRGNITVALERRSSRPLMVARRDVFDDHRFALLAVDVEAPIDPMVRVARRVLGPVQAELFTVLDDALRVQMIVADATQDDLEDYDRGRVQEAYKVLIEAAGRVAEPGWAPRTRVAQGVPSREIRARVQAGGCDVLVLQPEAKGLFVRALVGSLTEEMLARSEDCDLLIVPAQP